MLSEQTLHEKVTVSSEDTVGVPPFSLTLSGHGLKLNRAQTHTLQVNVGFLCNQTCRHCHLNAGPARKENMESGIVDEVVSYARRSQFETIDITGGAPELNPYISRLIQDLKWAGLRSRIVISLQRITAIPALPVRDLLEAGLLKPEFRFGF